MLSVEDIRVDYGKTRALHGVSINVSAGEIVSLVGVNGAGKSSLLQAIAGLERPVSGTIVLEGRDITGLSASAIARMGLALVPEGRDLFPDMTVRENLEMGAYRFPGTGHLAAEIERIGSFFPVLLERSGQRASTLSGGEQQMLAVGRALMSRPRVLLLDEPSLGIAPRIVDQIFEIILSINRDSGTTIVLVEQNTRLALTVSHRAYVLETGQITAEGTGAELAASEAVRRTFLGLA